MADDNMTNGDKGIQLPPPKTREMLMGFDSQKKIEPGETFEVISHPQVLFRGRRLLLPDTIAENFLINDIRIGKLSQFVSADPVPGLLFTTHVAFAFNGNIGVGISDLKMQTAQLAQDVVLRVTNTGPDPLRFLAGLFGDMLDVVDY